MDFMTTKQVMAYLDVNEARIYQLRNAGHIKRLERGIYDRKSIEDYKQRRGDKKGGPYPKAL